MRFPVVYRQQGALISLNVDSGGNRPPLSSRFENTLGDEGAVGAVFDALAAAELITRQRIEGIQLNLSDDSYHWVCKQKIVICGDSLGLPVLLSLLAKISNIRVAEYVAATGALSIANKTVMVRAVSDLTLKIEAASQEGVTSLICPTVAELPNKTGKMQIHQIREVGNDLIGELLDG